MFASHKMPWAGLDVRLSDQLSGGTDGLEAVVLNNDGFPLKQPHEHRSERWTCYVYYIGSADEPPESQCSWFTDDAERHLRIFKLVGRSTGDQGDIKFGIAVGLP